MDASVTRISSNKQSLTQECAMKQGLKRVIKVTEADLQLFQTFNWKFFCEKCV